jgi:hypothetical protein
MAVAADGDVGVGPVCVPRPYLPNSLVTRPGLLSETMQLFQTDSRRRRTTRHFSPVARSHIPTMYQLLWEHHIVHTDKTVFR